MRRRRRIFFRNLLIIAIVAGLVVGFYYMFFNKKSKIKTVNQTTKKSQSIEFQTADAPKVEIILPDTIHDTTDNTTEDPDNPASNDKKYEPLQSIEEREFPKRYLETITTENEITVLIGDDSKEYIDQGASIQLGAEYKVQGIEEPMKTAYVFNISDYNYPILLLLSQSGKLYYIDTQKAFSSAEFKIDGQIKDIPEVDSVHETKVEKDGQTYSTAVITCKNGEGYEFNLKMCQ